MTFGMKKNRVLRLLETSSRNLGSGQDGSDGYPIWVA